MNQLIVNMHDTTIKQVFAFTVDNNLSFDEMTLSYS